MSSSLRRFSLVLALALPLGALAGCFDDDDDVTGPVLIDQIDVTTEVDSGNGDVLDAVGLFEFASGEFLDASLAGEAVTLEFQTGGTVEITHSGGSAVYDFTTGSITLTGQVSVTGSFPDVTTPATYPASLEIDAGSISVGDTGQATLVLTIDGEPSDPITVELTVVSQGGDQVSIEIEGVEVVSGTVDGGGTFTGTGSGS